MLQRRESLCYLIFYGKHSFLSEHYIREHMKRRVEYIYELEWLSTLEWLVRKLYNYWVSALIVCDTATGLFAFLDIYITQSTCKNN